MLQTDELLPKERLSATEALLQEARHGNHTWLHLAVTEALALVHVHLVIAGSNQATQFIVLLCGYIRIQSMLLQV